MIQKIKLLLLLCALLTTSEATSQVSGEAREYTDSCIHFNDSTFYSFRLEVLKDSLIVSRFFEMRQNITLGEESYDVSVDIDSFQTKSKMYSNEPIKKFLTDVKLDYRVVHNGFDVTNKNEVWSSFFYHLPPEVNAQMLGELGDKKDSVLNIIEPMGQFLQFTSLAIQMHNIAFSQDGSTFWSGYLHGEFYQINNILIPCEFELTYVGNDKFELKTTIDVLEFKRILRENGISNRSEGLTTETSVSSTSLINGATIEMFIWNRPDLYSANYNLRWVYQKID
jgi:hypothetical protein